MIAASVATVLLDVLSLVQAGFELKGIVDQVQAMEASGSTQEEIHAYLKGLRDVALKDLSLSIQNAQQGLPHTDYIHDELAQEAKSTA